MNNFPEELQREADIQEAQNLAAADRAAQFWTEIREGIRTGEARVRLDQTLRYEFGVE